MNKIFFLLRNIGKYCIFFWFLLMFFSPLARYLTLLVNVWFSQKKIKKNSYR